MTQPDAATLTKWLTVYQRRAFELRRALTASYTPEQLALVERITEANRQIRLCRERLSTRERAHTHLIKWPDPPEK